jgi:acetate kinase
VGERAILTVNAGSSSLKFSLYRIAGGQLALASHGAIDGIGGAPRFRARDPDGGTLAEQAWTDGSSFEFLLGFLLDWVEGHLAPDRLAAVGHRVVYGLARHAGPERVTPDLLEALAALAPLAPLHVPHNLAPIGLIAKSHPGIPQVACFDTAFHHAMPEVATRFALPPEFAAGGVRRYGFHGLSYDFISRRLRAIEPALAEGRIIACHLGNGASLCAMKGGRSVDTTMGFTALDGLVMGTRSGSLDPGVVLYMMQGLGMSAGQIEDTLYRRSGLLGLSGGLSSDMRALLASPEPLAARAVESFVYRIVREIGALASVLGGVDGIVFSAGIGENAPEIRAKVCAGLGWLGARLDDEANGQGRERIGLPGSRVALMVIPTDEEAMIARQSLEILDGVRFDPPQG